MIPARQAPPPPDPVSRARLLLVEGNTAMHFFEALLQHIGLDQAIEIRNFGGVADFKDFIIDLARTTQFQRIVTSVGVIRDAEDKPAASARQSILGGLVAAGLTATRIPPISTAVFILPDDANAGMLETLCMQAVESEPVFSKERICTAEFFACLNKNGVALPAEPKLAKNRAQAYLATRMDVQLFPGQAAYRRYWPFDSAVFDPLKKFLQAL